MYKTSMSTHVSRRDFVKTVTVSLGTLMGAILGLPAIGYLISPALNGIEKDVWVPVGSLQDYPIGVPKPFSFTRSQINGWEKSINSLGIFVVRQDETQVLVVSNICTHLGCRVSWHPDIQNYVSPCHDGHFDMVGNVVSGPPPRPLDEYKTKIENGKLYIQYPPYKRS